MHERLWSSKRTGACGLFLLASALYFAGISPTIAWRDSSEFVTVVHALGISHPAGSPTYALLAKLPSFLPIGSIALRVNLFSALFGALVVSLLFTLLYELLSEAPPWTRLCAASSGAFFLCVSESFWRFAEIAEVYTLQDCFLVLLLTVLLKARTVRTLAQPLQTKWYWLFAFLYGLSAGVHATMAFFAPAFLIFIWLTAPWVLKGKELALGTFFFVLGFAVYLYLPLRSLNDPVLDWGDPQTFQQLLIHLLDRKDGTARYSISWMKLPYQCYVYLANLSNEFSMLGVALGLLGCLYILYRDTSLGIMLGLVFLGNVVFFVRAWTAAFGFLPSFVIFSIWIGLGVHACLILLATAYQRRLVRIPQVAVYSFFVGSIIATLSSLYVLHLPVANQTKNYSAELYGTYLLEQLPSDAILFSDFSWFPLLYLQHIEQRRPDLTVLLQGEVFTPQYYAPLSKKRFPNIRLSSSTEPMVMSTEDYFWLLAKSNHADHPLFWDPEPDYDTSIGTYLLPRGLLFALNPEQKTDITPEVLHTHRQLWLQAIPHILAGRHDDEAAQLLASKLNIIGRHLRRRGFATEAANMYQMGLSIRPGDYYLHNDYGRLLMAQGQFRLALTQFNAAYSINPVLPALNKNLGTLLLRLGDNARAAHFFERALSLGRADGDLYALMGETHINLGQWSVAQRALRSALKLFAETPNTNSDDEGRQKKITWVRENLHRLEQGPGREPSGLVLQEGLPVK